MQLAHHHAPYAKWLKPALLLALVLLGSAALTGCKKTFPPVKMPIEVTALSDETIQPKIAASRGYLLVHFTSYDPHCGYCVDSNPYADKLAQKYLTTLEVARIHWEPWTDYADRSGAIKKQFGIRGIPMFVLYKDGREVWRAFGYTVETLNALQAQLQRCCG